MTPERFALFAMFWLWGGLTAYVIHHAGRCHMRTDRIWGEMKVLRQEMYLESLCPVNCAPDKE